MSKCELCRHRNSDEGWVLCEECMHEESLRDLFTPMTNADHIRTMTDDELAVFLCDMNGCEYPTTCPGRELCKKGDGESNGLKKWLQQPYESEETP